jgi:hypothetical protein
MSSTPPHAAFPYNPNLSRRGTPSGQIRIEQANLAATLTCAPEFSKAESRGVVSRGTGVLSEGCGRLTCQLKYLGRLLLGQLLHRPGRIP